MEINSLGLLGWTNRRLFALAIFFDSSAALTPTDV
jgi:hypothetical protein